MTDSPSSYIESAERLCATLERIGDALVDLDTTTLLETQDTLSRLVAVLASGEAPEHAALAPLVKRGRDALLRCRRLGASYSGIAKVRLSLCTGGGYGRDGEYVENAARGSIKATV